MAGTMDRVRTLPLVRELGFGDASPVPRPSDPPVVRQLLTADWFADEVRAQADRLDRDPESVRTEAAACLREMSATRNERLSDTWMRFGKYMLRAYDVIVDEDAAARVKHLDRDHALIFLMSHRSYLDAWAAPQALVDQHVSPPYGFGGANLNFFPFGTVLSRTGGIFIRRDTKDAPVYRFALRSYIGQLVRDQENLIWSIEGGRTRTGKLRPPMYGILRYVLDAIGAVEGPEVYAIPVSIVYDQLHEVALMTDELRGGKKQPEDVGWLLKLTRQQGKRLGRAFVDFGEPLPLRERLATLAQEDSGQRHAVERIALDVSHRINRATPVTTTSVITLALLGANRSLTLDEVLATVRPLAGYIGRMHWPVAGGADLTDRGTIRRGLKALTESGVLSSYDGGTEPVWGITDEQHLVASFYRNSIIHILVNRAIGEVALLAAAEFDGDARGVGWAQAFALRDLLKFEFFFAPREEFRDELSAELGLLDKAADYPTTPAESDELLRSVDLHLAHQVLRPFLEAYLVVAEQLEARGDQPIEDAAFVDECLRVARQRQLQRRLVSPDAVSTELFKNGLRLARHRELVDNARPDLAERRRAFADELRLLVRRVNTIAGL